MNKSNNKISNKKNKNKIKALVLFSGGLDSRLVVKLLQDQNIEVELLNFKLPFGCGCCSNLGCNVNFSQLNGAKLTIQDCTKGKLFQEYIKMIKQPKFSRGSGINPCIDCKIFMFRKARDYAIKNKITIIATGEVLGQRPLSQNSIAMKKIDNSLGFEILRPLSAKLLSPTIYEKKGLVDRRKFLEIKGRSRKAQIDLAKKYDIKYPNPGGGCLLCEKDYSFKLNDLFKHTKKIKPEDIDSLNGSRHFRSNGKIIVGRNESENLNLVNLNKKLKYNLLIPKDPGPTILYESKKDRKIVEKILFAYSGKNLEKRKAFDKLRINFSS